MTKLKLPSDLKARIAEANSQGLRGEAHKNLILNGTRPKQEDINKLKLPIEIRDEMLTNAIPEDLCNFVHSFICRCDCEDKKIVL
jgi:hypothetical protein